MNSKTTEDKSKFTHYASQVLFYIGSIVALIVGITQSIDWWKNRDPKLELFIPYYSTGNPPDSNERVLMMLTRISNHRIKNAYIFPETMSVEVKKNDIWYKTKMLWVTERNYLDSDLPKYQKDLMGFSDVPVLKKFENTVITYDNPLSRYITVTHENESVLEEPTDIRIEVEDCHKKLYRMEINFIKQKRMHDPEYRHNN